MKKRIKHDKIWRYQNEGIPLKHGRQNSNSLATHARHVEFAG